MKIVFVLLFIFPFFCLPMESKIQTIVFDYGGVILQEVDRSHFTEFIQETFQFSSDEMTALLPIWRKRIMQDSEKEFWEELANKRKISLSEEWFQALEQKKVESLIERPEMFDLVKNLKEKGYQAAMLTNISKQLAKIVRLAGHYDLFNPLVLSYEIGVEKPDPKAFSHLLEILGQKPSQILFIDDQPENVQTAQSLGIDAIHFTCLDFLKQELAKRNF